MNDANGTQFGASHFYLGTFDGVREFLFLAMGEFATEDAAAAYWHGKPRHGHAVVIEYRDCIGPSGKVYGLRRFIGRRL